MTLTSQSTPIAAAVKLVDECVRDAEPLTFRGEVVAARRSSAGMWAELVDQENVVTLFVRRDVLRGRDLIDEQLLEVRAWPAVSKGDRCAWYLKAERFKVLDEVGPMAARRRQDLEKLCEDGVISRDRVEEFSFSKHWQVQEWPEIFKVLVLTSSDAAGWGDFKARVENLVDAGVVEQRIVPVQGEGMVQALVHELGKISAEEADLVFIVRGGGGWADLRRFDDPALARAISGCAVDVVTAVGHHKDASLADLAAFAALMTPTDAAAALDKAVFLQQQPAKASAGKRRRAAGHGPWIPPTEPVANAERALEMERARAEAVARERARAEDYRTKLAEERVRGESYRNELAGVQRQLEQSRHELGDLWRFTNRQLLDEVAARVTRRRWAPALGCWLAAFFSLGWQPGSPVGIALVLGLCGALVAAGMYVFRGPQRATRVPGARLQKRAPGDGRAWVELALRARTPRELRLLRFRRP
jgi:exodeoxyribonuclease VII large subunit